MIRSRDQPLAVLKSARLGDVRSEVAAGVMAVRPVHARGTRRRCRTLRGMPNTVRNPTTFTRPARPSGGRRASGAVRSPTSGRFPRG